MSTPWDASSKETSFLRSAMASDGSLMPLAEFDAWLKHTESSRKFSVTPISFSKLDQWTFEQKTGDLRHASGKFFRVEGRRVSYHPGAVSEWDQPIINQPEIGILGIVTKIHDGVRYFLMQAKMEPGNVLLNQLSPTVQATRSNYTQVHKGKLPLYLEYFTDRSKSRILVDQLQSEQGARFFRKRNRNMIVEVDDVPLEDNFCWLTLGQLKQLIRRDHVVNMDARSVISCAPFVDDKLRNCYSTVGLEAFAQLMPFGRPLEGFAQDVFISMVDTQHQAHTTDEIVSWFTEIKALHQMTTTYCPLREVRRWERTESEIRHESGEFFSVMAVNVEAEGREVAHWSQPLVAHPQTGIIGMISQKINGVLHFLIQAKAEPGNFDIVELSPTVACCDPERNRKRPGSVPFLDHFTNAREQTIRYDALQSEEGGRFYRVENRYMILELPAGEITDIPEDYAWVTLGQIIEFTKHNNVFNVEARGLTACISLLTDESTPG